MNVRPFAFIAGGTKDSHFGDQRWAERFRNMQARRESELRRDGAIYLGFAISHGA